MGIVFCGKLIFLVVLVAKCAQVHPSLRGWPPLAVCVLMFGTHLLTSLREESIKIFARVSLEDRLWIHGALTVYHAYLSMR